MANELRLRRGTSAQNNAFTGAQGEVTVDTDANALRLHDGLTAGGHPIARADLNNVDDATFLAKATAAGVGTGNTVVTAGAPTTASYVVLGADATLTNERILTAGAGIALTDAGAGGALSIAASLSSAIPASLASVGSAGTSTSVARADHVHPLPSAVALGVVPTSRTVSAGTGLTGGGALAGNITLSLSAGLSNLSDVTVTSPTNGDFLIYSTAVGKFVNSQNVPRLTTRAGGTIVGTAGGVSTINFTGATLTADATDPSVVNIAVTGGAGATTQAILDTVGTMVTGNTEKGIDVTYDAANGKLNFDVKDFTVSLTGDVQGTATVTDLANITIATVITPDAVALGTDTTGNYVATIATSNGITITNALGTTEGAAYTLGLDLNNTEAVEAVQDIVGTMVTGNTESGLQVIYDDTTGKLNFQANAFTLALSGAVTGSATIANLASAAITTVIPNNTINLGQHTVGNYIANIAGSGGIIVSGSGSEMANVTISIDTTGSDFVETIQDIVGTMVSPSNTENGIDVTYDDTTGKLNFDTRDFVVALSGPVTGSGTVTNLANATIATVLTDRSVTLGQHTSGNYVATLASNATTSPIILTNAAPNAVGSAFSIDLNTLHTSFVEGVEDAVGAMMRRSTHSGISAVYTDNDAGLGSLALTANSFILSMTGAILANATVAGLTNTTVATTLAANAVTLGFHTTGDYVRSLAVSSGLTLVNGAANTAGAVYSLALDTAGTTFARGARDAVGTGFSAGTKRGGAITYDANTNAFNYVANAFTITLTGAVTGSGTVTDLGNVTITTTSAGGTGNTTAGVTTFNGRSGAVTPLISDYASFYAPTAHPHAIQDVTNLQTSLDAKAAVSDTLVDQLRFTRAKLLTSATNLDTVTTSGFYDVQNPTNGPGTGWWYVNVFRHSQSASFCLQIAYDLDTSPSSDGYFIRSLNGTSWSSWKRIVTATDLAGKADAIHTHTIANVTNLQPSLDAKANVADYATSAEVLAATASKIVTGSVAWDVTTLRALTYGTTITPNLATGINFALTLTGATAALAAPVGAKVGQSGFIRISQDTTGSRLLTFASAYKFAGGTVPTLSTTASATDILYYTVIDASFIHCVLVKDVK